MYSGKILTLLVFAQLAASIAAEGIAVATDAAGKKAPITKFTPGCTCSLRDPDLNRIAYGDKHIAICNRHVLASQKRAVAALYQIGDIGGSPAKSKYDGYVFDHLVPLCAGGSNDNCNLWPEPVQDSYGKDTLERGICHRLANDPKFTQKDAIELIHLHYAKK